MYVISMHRTQILLKPHQYEALKARARQEGKSLSELIRIAVSQWLGDEPRARKARLADLCNLGRDPRGPAGRDHDSILYQWKRKWNVPSLTPRDGTPLCVKMIRATTPLLLL